MEGFTTLTIAAVDVHKAVLIGFGCGHIYHLRCLLERQLRASGVGDDVIETRVASIVMQLSAGDQDRGGVDAPTPRSVGGKVARAHLVGGVLRGSGCQVCQR